VRLGRGLADIAGAVSGDGGVAASFARDPLPRCVIVGAAAGRAFLVTSAWATAGAARPPEAGGGTRDPAPASAAIIVSRLAGVAATAMTTIALRTMHLQGSSTVDSAATLPAAPRGDLSPG
jgi:hypothetical protein